MKSIDIHMRAISQEMPQPSITKISLKITYLKFHSNFPGANELKYWLPFLSPIIWSLPGNAWRWDLGWSRVGRLSPGPVAEKITKTFNPLCAKFFRGNINIYLHFTSLFHTETTEVHEIFLRVRRGPTYSNKSISWLLITWRRKEPGHQQPC